MRHQFYLLSLLGPVVATPFLPGRHSLAVSKLDKLLPRDDDFYPEDLSWINKLAAIGDSYSAGIGAGDRLGSVLQAFEPQSDYACSRYDHAYPQLIHNDERLGDPSKRKFQFVSCSGAVTKDVLDIQIPALDSDQQAILLSIGGNDVELVNILNQCIFQWAVLNTQQVDIGKIATEFDKKYEWASGLDWDALGRGCAGQLQRTQSLVEGGDFSKSLDSVLDAAKKKLAKDGIIYLTGYGKFFSETMTADCDKVSWSTWLYKAANMFQPEAKLSQPNRKYMNDLVDKVNDKLADAAKRAGSSVRFVNYDSYIGEFNGRYCEPGVDESTSESNTRTGLMFYELNTFDPLGSTPWKRSPDGSLNGTFDGHIDTLAQITLFLDPSATLNDAVKTKNDTATGHPAAQQADAKPDTHLTAVNNANTASSGQFEVPNILPDGYGRVFHPQILLHTIIANRVIYEMVSDNEQSHGLPTLPEMISISSCPLRVKPTPTQPQPTAPPSPSNLKCWPEWGRPLSEYGAVRPDQYKAAADKACAAFKKQNGLNNANKGTYAYETKDGDVPYWFTVGPRTKGTACDTTNLVDPFGDGSFDCNRIFKESLFGACSSNSGRGGHVDAGCLNYGFDVCDGDSEKHPLRASCYTNSVSAPWVVS